LHVKILKRSADFTPQLVEKTSTTTGKLLVPKKTKLFVDQTMRERENSIGINIIIIIILCIFIKVNRHSVLETEHI